MYRNSLSPPLLFLMLGLMLLWMNWGTPIYRRSGEKHPNLFKSIVDFGVLSLILGSTICLVLLLKEDAEWCIPLVAFVGIFKGAMFAWKYRKWTKKLFAMGMIVVMLIPIGSGIELCKSINKKYFGVPMLNTRTEGELADFVRNVYIVDSKDQNYEIWAPESSIDAIFSVSPTLSKDPKLLWSVKHVMFTAPDIKQKPIYGDFLTWQIRFSYENTYGWTSETDVQNFFARANTEIKQAFDSGRLQRTTKMRLSGLLVPRDTESVAGLLPKASVLWRYSLTFEPYQETQHGNSMNQAIENIKGLECMHVDASNPNPLMPGVDFALAKRVSVALVKTYRLMNCSMAVITILALVAVIVQCIKKKRRSLLIAVGCVGLASYAWVYCFSVKWFSEYLHDAYIDFFYSGSVAIPFIAFSLLLGLGLFCSLVHSVHTVETLK